MIIRCAVLLMFFIAFGPHGVFAEELIGETIPISLRTAHPYKTTRVAETVTSIKVSREGATFIIVHFSNFSLNEGDFVAIRDGEGVLRQVITNDDPGKTDFWAFAVDGDTAFVDLVSGSTEVQAYGFDIDQYGYGFFSLGIASICGDDDKVDIECVNGTTQYERSRSVGRMYYQKGTNWYLCTGSLVSEENHFLSNEHCVNSQAIVDTLQVRFNYQHTTCGGSTVAAYDTYYGDAFLVSNYNYDCSLMTLSGDPQTTYGYLELDPKDMVLNETVYIPQHPGGRPMEYDSNIVNDPVADGYTANSDFGYQVDTEGGSSGSPVLSMSDHKVVGVHHWGGCTAANGQNQGVLMKHVYTIIEPYLPAGYDYCYEPSTTSTIYEFNKESIWLIGETRGGSCGEGNPLIGWLYEGNWVLARDIPSAESCTESIFYWGNMGPTKNYDWIDAEGSTGTGTLYPCSTIGGEITGDDAVGVGKDISEGGAHCLVDDWGNQYNLTVSGIYIEGTANTVNCGTCPLIGMVKGELFSFYVDIPSAAPCLEGYVVVTRKGTMNGRWHHTDDPGTGSVHFTPCVLSTELEPTLGLGPGPGEK